jgi:hypothetical protein
LDVALIVYSPPVLVGLSLLKLNRVAENSQGTISHAHILNAADPEEEELPKVKQKPTSKKDQSPVSGSLHGVNRVEHIFLFS